MSYIVKPASLRSLQRNQYATQIPITRNVTNTTMAALPIRTHTKYCNRARVDPADHTAPN
jgi:hypothetical protein